MSEKPGRWDLSYVVSFVTWDGKRLHRVDESVVRRELELFRDLGLRSVFVAGIQFVEESDFDMFNGVRRMRQLLDEYGFEVTSNHCVLPSLSRLGQSQQAVREQMLKVVDCCALIRPKALVIHPGLLDDRAYWDRAFDGFNEEVARHGLDRYLETAADNLKFMGRAAAGANMTLALETMGRFAPTGDTPTLERLVKMIDEPNVGYCLDSGHLHAFGESVKDWVYRARGKLFETHFHDNRALGLIKYPDQPQVRDVSAVDEHMPVGFGTIPWIDVIRALDATGFPGPVTFETGGWPVDDPRESFEMAIRWWRTCETYALHKYRRA